MAAEHSAPQRIAYFDVLRVLATFAVIVLHLSAQHWADVDVMSGAWQAFNLYSSSVRWAICIFVMISGALFLSGTQSIGQILRKNVLRIITAFLFWSALYAVYGIVFYGYSLRTAALQLINGHYHMWFLYMIVGLYLIVPLLRPIAQSEKLTRYFLLLALFFNFLLPLVSSVFWLTSWEYYNGFQTLTGMLYYHFTLGFTFYFVLGYYLSRSDIPARLLRWSYRLGVLGLILTASLTSLASRSKGTATVLFYNYDTVNVLMMCLGLFLFARSYLNLPTLGEKGHARIRALSRWSFGAYLVHPMVIEALDQFLHINTLSLNAFFSVPLLAVFVFAVSTAISALLSRVPIVNKYFI